MSHRHAAGRAFLRADHWAKGSIDADQARGVEEPPRQVPLDPAVPLLSLPSPQMPEMSLGEALSQRRSRRRLGPDPLSPEHVAALCWACQGVSGTLPVLRTAPSAGARHPFETHLIVHAVDGLAPGLYRYRPEQHQLAQMTTEAHDPKAIAEACCRQNWTRRAPLVVVWTALPYRSEWRYGDAAHKAIAIDVGHAAQNLYLACEGFNLATCTIAAFDPGALDALLGIDGINEFSIYLAPVGRRA